jgi:hypothetical protein
MQFIFAFLDLNQNNVLFLYDVFHSPFYLTALIAAVFMLYYGLRPVLFEHRSYADLSRKDIVLLICSVAIVILIAAFVN